MHDLRFLSGNTVEGDQSDCGPKRVDQQNLESGKSPHFVDRSRNLNPDRPETTWKMFSFIELPLYRSCQYYPFGHRNNVLPIFHPSEPVFSTNGLCGFIRVRLEPLPQLNVRSEPQTASKEETNDTVRNRDGAFISNWDMCCYF